MKLSLVAALAMVICTVSTASAQSSGPSRQEIEATKAAILKEGPRVPHDIYQKVVPAYVSQSGKITDKGAAVLSEAVANADSAPSASPNLKSAQPAQSDIPDKSLLRIKETSWTEDFKTDPEQAKESQRQLELRNPGVSISVSTKCRGVRHKFLFTPTVSLGKDVEAGEPKLHVWVLEENKNPETKKRKIRVIEPRTFPPPTATGDISSPVEYDYMQWKCSCCRPLNGKEFMGWYAELRVGDKVLVTAKSVLVPKAQEALDDFLAAGSVSNGQ